MLATLVIGLREGLEAALVVGIVAAFLKRNGRGLGAMWAGVALAVAASVAVGVGLFLLESALPQAAQEGLETVIGAVAVVFVTGMLLWMNTHARTMKRELETQADAALADGTAWALAAMAFLAVLKEGFETSVFLLATFRAVGDTGLAAAGAVIGILASAAIGVGIYTGGVRIDLARFFRFTGAFLILVAAGLVLTAVRTAHEAGWIVTGQQRTVDLTWLAPAGTVQGAIVTGVLGIPADPRLIEVVAWAAYLVPVALIVLWPARRRPSAAAAVRIRWAAAGGIAVCAAVLALVVPAPATDDGAALPLAGAAGSARIAGDDLAVASAAGAQRVRLGAGTATEHAGLAATVRTATGTAAVAGPATVTLTQLAALNGGRVPVGISAAVDAGPFTASWRATTTTTAWTAGGTLLDAARTARTVLTVSGGGLTTSRTLAPTGASAPVAATWRVAPGAVRQAADRVRAASAAGPEHALWAVQVPLALLIAALAVAASAVAARRRYAAAAAPESRPIAPRSTPYAVK